MGVITLIFLKNSTELFKERADLGIVGGSKLGMGAAFPLINWMSLADENLAPPVDFDQVDAGGQKYSKDEFMRSLDPIGMGLVVQSAKKFGLKI